MAMDITITEASSHKEQEKSILHILLRIIKQKNPHNFGSKV